MGTVRKKPHFYLSAFCEKGFVFINNIIILSATLSISLDNLMTLGKRLKRGQRGESYYHTV